MAPKGKVALAAHVAGDAGLTSHDRLEDALGSMLEALRHHPRRRAAELPGAHGPHAGWAAGEGTHDGHGRADDRLSLGTARA